MDCYEYADRFRTKSEVMNSINLALMKKSDDPEEQKDRVRRYYRSQKDSTFMKYAEGLGGIDKTKKEFLLNYLDASLKGFYNPEFRIVEKKKKVGLSPVVSPKVEQKSSLKVEIAKKKDNDDEAKK